MKKWIAMLLAVMMLVLPLAGLAEAPEELMDKALDDGLTLEILRCCTDGTGNACSKLYGACCRIGFVMGYDRIITYTLASETGASLRAAGFTFDGIAGGRAWTGQRRRDYYVAPAERKHRWMKRRIGVTP